MQIVKNTTILFDPKILAQIWRTLKRKISATCCFTTRYADFGGERGIRTPGTLQYAGFQDRCIRPLCHLSMQTMVVFSCFRVNSKNRRNRRNSSENYRIYLIRPRLQDHQGTEKANNVGKPLPTSGSHLLLTGIYSKIECNEGNIHLYR